MAVHELCPGCMGRITEEQMQCGCPYCGYRLPKQGEVSPHILPPHTVLQGKYLIGRTLGAGGCGITYLGYDLNLELRIAIKEYYPVGFVARDVSEKLELTAGEGDKGAFFSEGKKKFIQEARMLARFAGLRSIVSVRDYFEENNTCYIIMEYLDGETLKSYLTRRGGRISCDELMRMLQPLLASLNEVHRQGLIHRDISPDNIMILRDGTLKLLDFGSARDMAGNAERSASVMLKPGYAPEEQYRMYGAQGTWTDVYALCATIYRCLTGHTPVDALTRKERDTLIPPSQYGAALTPQQEAALLKGMAVDAGQRYKTIGEFYRGFYCNEIPAARSVPPQNMQGRVPASGLPRQTAVQGQAQWGASVSMPNPGVPLQNTYQMAGGAGYKTSEVKKKRLFLIVAAFAAAAAVLVLIPVLISLFLDKGDGGDQAWRQEQIAGTDDEGVLVSGQPAEGDPEGAAAQESGQEGTTLPNGLSQSMQAAQPTGEGMRGLSHNLEDGELQQSSGPKLCCDIPEEFTERSEGVFCAPDYPNDTANINILTAVGDRQTFQYTKESYCEAVKYLYEQAYGYDIEVNCTEFVQSELNGCKTLMVRMSYNLLGVMEVEQIQFSVETETDKVTTITMSQPAGGGWMDTFERVLESIRVE